MSSTSLYPTSRLWRGTWLRQSCLDVFMSAAFFVIGFSPITALAVAILGLLPLPITTLTIVLPATVLGIFLALRFTAYGKLALQGLILGLIAVFLYDCMRVPFILTGVWGDFIPKINMWLFNTSHPNWMVGYVWRYLGDGGFMGMALGIFFPYVCRESTIEAGSEGASLDLEPKVKETLFEEETTIKLPPIRWHARPLYQPQGTHSIP